MQTRKLACHSRGWKFPEMASVGKVLLACSLLILLVSAQALSGADLRGMIPRNILSFMIIDLEKFWTTDLSRAIRKFVLSMIPEIQRSSESWKKTYGFDPRDFRKIGMFVTEHFDPKTKKHDMIFLFEGPFDEGKCLDCFRNIDKIQPWMTGKFQVCQVDGINAVKLLGQDETSRLGSIVAFPSSTTMILAEEPMVHSIRETLAGRNPSLLANEEMNRLLVSVDPTSVLWGAGFLSRNLKDRLASGDARLAPFGAIDDLHYSFDCASGIQYAFSAHLDDPRRGEQVTVAIGEILDRFKDMCRFQNHQVEYEVILAFLDRIKVGRAESTVTISLQTSKAEFDEAHRKIDQRHSSGPKYPGVPPENGP